MNTIASPETIAARSIFLRELLPLLTPDYPPEVLALAKRSHLLPLQPEQEPTAKNWQRFLKVRNKLDF